MTTDRRHAIAALTTAGLLWGTTVPLSKLALGWLGPGWLTVARFGLAAGVLLFSASRSAGRDPATPPGARPDPAAPPSGRGQQSPGATRSR